MPIAEQIELLSRGTTEIIDPKSLIDKLERSAQLGQPLCIKAGFDPTAPDIHLGHVVLLRKLRQFQDLGHRIVFLIGDFTAQIGDPTGRDQLRPKMSSEVIAENAQTYRNQVFKILDSEKAEVVFNSQWLAGLSAEEVLKLSAHSTVAQMLARADFKKRFEEQKEISLLEFFYPLLQGYDSVHLQADVELGGNDQKFNLLMGRQLQEVYGQEPQVVMMTPLLEGTDGMKKMSKSLGNYVGINEPPRDILGKIMSISDELMYRYYEILTTENLEEIKARHPKEAKMHLGKTIVTQFYDESTAEQACQEFERVFSQGQLPDDMPTYTCPEGQERALIDVLLESGLVSSRNEVRRLVSQGSVSFGGQKIVADDWKVEKGILKVGKRRFLKIQ